MLGERAPQAVQPGADPGPPTRVTSRGRQGLLEGLDAVQQRDAVAPGDGQ
ncbi:hypothetical protein [Phytohabitans rumicis]|nr:hypothetical protein [Phytohabitans rumicis]